MTVHIKLVLEPGLARYAEWILSFVQEMGVSTDLERGWSTQQNLFLSFSIYEAKTGPRKGSTQQNLFLSFLIYEAKTGPSSTLCFLLLEFHSSCFWLASLLNSRIFQYNFQQ